MLKVSLREIACRLDSSITARSNEVRPVTDEEKPVGYCPDAGSTSTIVRLYGSAVGAVS